jgi:polyhydroxyalkanoate synthesis regulator phasin
MFEKIAYNLVGVLSLTNTKVKELLEDLIQNNQYTEDEGKRIVNSMVAQVKDKNEEVISQIKSNVDSLTSKIKLPEDSPLQSILGQFKDKIEKLPIKK